MATPQRPVGAARRVQNLCRHLSAHSAAHPLPSSPDDDGLLEYSVVYSDRGLNHMSKEFQGVMNEISENLKQVYHAHSVAIIPGSGSYGMEAVARQFATDKHVLVIRNGYFSFRWTDIFDRCGIPASHTVLKARPDGPGATAQFSPCPIAEVVARIRAEKPAVVFAPHVETSAGMILPDDYIRAVADAAHSVGGIFVLDCVASGCLWVDMESVGADVVITAPQKGWSADPCAALVMLSPAARKLADTTKSTSMVIDLSMWLKVMDTYESGGHMYYTTMPTNALVVLRDVTRESRAIGYDNLKRKQIELGAAMRSMLTTKGVKSVAAPHFQAPTVVVSHTADKGQQSGAKFTQAGVQIASGVPLKCDEHPDYSSFRIGLFGIDKLQNIERTVGYFESTMAAVTN